MTTRSKRKFDMTMLILTLSLVSIGWLMVFSVGYDKGYPTTISGFLATQAGKETIWIFVAAIIFTAVILIDKDFWRTFAYPIYFLSLLTLVGVLLFGTNINNARSWFSFGGFSIQPSEFAKFATALAIANYSNEYTTNIKEIKSQLIGFSIILLPAVLITLQPDPGSALVFTSFLLLLFRLGLSGTFFVLGFGAVALLLLSFVFPPIQIILVLLLVWIFLLIKKKRSLKLWYPLFGLLLAANYLYNELGYTKQVFAADLIIFLGLVVYEWMKEKRQLGIPLLIGFLFATAIIYTSNYGFNKVLKPHQQERINVWLNPGKCDPQGSLYNVLQSKMAIASGGFSGKGFLQGNLTKGNYVPEQDTDFIFCTVGEEQGFLGSAGTVIFFVLLLLRIIVLAERQRSNFAKYYAYGIAGIFFIHFIINIGMTIGLMPVIGVPLPFISKGGSSLLGFTIMIAVLVKMDSERFS